MSISSDEVNYLIYRYLQENGFLHAAFAFAHESLVIKSTVSQVDIPPGALITFLQKGLEYIGIEEHIREDGTIQEFDTNYSLLSPFVCDSIATKEDRRFKQMKSTDSLSSMAENADAGEANSSLKLAAIPSVISVRQSTPVSLKHLSLSGHDGEVFMCMWNPVVKQLASGSSDGMCRLWGLDELVPAQWDAPDRTELNLRTAVLPHADHKSEKNKDVTSIAWSPEGDYIATGCYDGTARIWSANGSIVAVLKDHSGPVFSLKWSKKGTHLLSGSYDRRAIVWSLATGKAVKIFVLHTAPVLDVDWKDGDMFATCSTDCTIVVCSLSSPDTNAIAKFTGHTDEVNTVCWSPGGDYVASCSDDHTAKIWTLQGLQHNLTGHLKEIYTVRWTPTGRGSANPDKPLYLCTASFDGNVKVWSSATGGLVFNLRRHAQPVYSISSNPTGELLATGSLGGHVTIWNLKTGELTAELLGNGDTFDVSWSHDSNLLCACFSSGNLSVFDTHTWFDILRRPPVAAEEQPPQKKVAIEVVEPTTATTTAAAAPADKQQSNNDNKSRSNSNTNNNSSSSTGSKAAAVSTPAATAPTAAANPAAAAAAAPPVTSPKKAVVIAVPAASHHHSSPQQQTTAHSRSHAQPQGHTTSSNGTHEAPAAAQSTTHAAPAAAPSVEENGSSIKVEPEDASSSSSSSSSADHITTNASTATTTVDDVADKVNVKQEEDDDSNADEDDDEQSSTNNIKTNGAAVAMDVVASDKDTNKDKDFKDVAAAEEDEDDEGSDDDKDSRMIAEE